MPIGKSDHRLGHTDDVGDPDEGIDFAKIKMILGFFLRAPRRRPVLAIVTPAVALVLAICAAAWLPRVYTADMRIIAHRNGILPEHEGSPPMPEPTAGVADEILKRDNLEALVKNLDLVARWDATRPPVLRFKDWVFGVLRGRVPDEAKGRALVAALEQRLQVSIEQNSITLSVDWPNPQVAYEIVNAAYKSFLDARVDSEVNVYSERLKVLEMRAQFAAQDVDTAIAELTKREQERRQSAADTSADASAPAPQGQGQGQGQWQGGEVAAAGAVARPVPTPAPPGDVSSSDETAHALEEVRAQIRAGEEEQRRRVAEADGQLADALGALGPLHPTVLALKRKGEALGQPSLQLEALRAREKDLVARLAAGTPAPVVANGAATGPFFRPVAPAPTVSGVPSELREMLLNRDDAPTAYARSKLQATSSQYNDILSRVQLAKIELDVARASFIETYLVVRPAELPVRPRKPNVSAIIAVGFFAALFLAFLVPGARDLLTGRILEPWQVESGLRMPVLGALPAADSIRPPASDTGPSP
jgi:capsular polysaccharide biosynthesis protein